MNKDILLQDQLKRTGLKTTRSRMAILDIMHDKDCPVTAEEIFLSLKEKEYQTNLSTVYRTLEALETADLVSRIQILNEDKKMFALNEVGHRHYLVCLECKRMVTIHGCPLENYDQHVEDETGFVILGHKLYLYGYCKECRPKRKVSGIDSSC